MSWYNLLMIELSSFLLFSFPERIGMIFMLWYALYKNGTLLSLLYVLIGRSCAWLPMELFITRDAFQEMHISVHHSLFNYCSSIYRDVHNETMLFNYTVGIVTLGLMRKIWIIMHENMEQYNRLYFTEEIYHLARSSDPVAHHHHHHHHLFLDVIFSSPFRGPM